MKKMSRWFSQLITSLDLWILIPYLLLGSIGVVMVYSASSDIGNPIDFMFKQLAFFIMGFVILLFASRFRLNKLRNSKFIVSTMVIFFCILSLLKVFGKSINGASGWLTIGSINLQPSEFAKLFLVIYMANALASRQSRFAVNQVVLVGHHRNWLSRIYHDPWWRSMFPPILFASAIVILIKIQPDLGSAIINGVIVLILILTCGHFNYKKSLGFGLGLLVFTIAAFYFYLIPKALSPAEQNNYQYQRIVAFVSPFRYAQGIGKQLVNSYYALSNGGIFGVGLGNSIQKMGYLPEPNTDFIMAIVSEELGVIGVIIIMILLAVVVAKIVLVGIRDNDIYYSLICYGVATYIIIEMFFNMGGVIGMLPITGVTFPFISYGGSSMLTLSAGVGMALNIDRTQARRRFQIRIRKE